MTITQLRTQELRHHLDPHLAAMPADPWWLVTRTHQFAAAAGITVDVVLDAVTWCRRTGLQVGRWWAGAAFVGEPGARVPVPLIYLNRQLCPTRGQAELVIVHEMMHARWPSYGHRKIAFDRAQQLLDVVPAPRS
ncbi:hypothetical protein [Actinoplanes sp. G11-F43]|uniref:hypothetical protein n=1 Tax=Actinoplanes sp. G11-F43 TaxID=3424130 RepID=UPI003D3494D8